MSDIFKRILTVSRWLFGPMAVLFLVLAGFSSRAVFQQALSQAHALPIAITIGLCALLHPLTAMFSWMVLRETGATIVYTTVLGIHVQRLPARYLPGGIWQTVSRMMDLHRMGVSRRQLSILVLVENIVPFAVALGGGGLCLYLSGEPVRLPLVGAIFGGLFLLAGLPVALRHRLLLSAEGIALSRYLVIVAIVAAFWATASTAFAFYWSAFPAADLGGSLLRVFGAYQMAWAAGFAAIFAPQGLGVFESTASLLLRGTQPFGGIAVLVAGFRAAVLAGDFLAYGTLLLLRNARSGTSQQGR